MHRRLISIGTLCLFVLLGNPSAAADSPADLDAYCRAVHGDGAFQGIDRRDNGFLCTIGMDPGPGMIHHKMQPADACAEQFGTTSFRREGEKIICTSVREGNTRGESNKVDLAAYCLSEYGESAEVSRNNITGAAMCTVRTDGGLGMLHNIIDVVSLCPAGSSAGPVTGTILSCLGGNSAGSGTATADPAGGAGGGQTDKSGKKPPHGNDIVEDGERYSGEIITGETWRGIEGEASYFPWLDLRIESDGDKIRAYVSSRHNRQCGTIINYRSGDDCMSDIEGIVPDTLVLVGDIRDDQIKGRTRLTMSYFPFPACVTEWEKIKDNPPLWIDFTGRIEGDRINLRLDPEGRKTFMPYIAPMPNAVPECRLVPLVENNVPPDPENPAAIVGNPPQNIRNFPALEFVNSISFQRLNDGPKVVEIKVVGAEPPFKEAGSVVAGQRLRVRLTVDIDSSGQEIKTSIKSGGKSLSLVAVCGASPDGNPRICISPIFQLE